MGEHGQSGPAVPGGPAADLVLIQPGELLGRLGFFDAPAPPGHADQGAQRDRVWAVAAQVGQLAGAVVAPDQQMMAAGVGVVLGAQRDPGPRVKARALAARPGRMLLPGPARQDGGDVVDPDRAGRGGHPPVSRDRQHVTQPVAADRGPQGRVGAEHLVGGDPSGGYLRVDGALDQRVPAWGGVGDKHREHASATTSAANHNDHDLRLRY